jgi:hypothetical protein
MRPEAVELCRRGRPSMGSGVRIYLTKKEHIVPRARKNPGQPPPFMAKLDLLDPIFPSWSFPTAQKGRGVWGSGNRAAGAGVTV